MPLQGARHTTTLEIEPGLAMLVGGAIPPAADSRRATGAMLLAR